MTPSVSACHDEQAAASRSQSVWLFILVALLVGLALSLPRVTAVWQTGAFFDSDDATRLVQVRNLLAGQAWFDMTIYRLDPPAGVFMHWSRVVDVPLVILIKGFSIFFAPDYAERAARLAFPLALQVLLYIGIARMAVLLIGRAATVPTILLTFLSGMSFGQFQPGRIDHHAPQIVLLVFMVGNAIAALDPGRARCAAWGGLLAAVSLAISIETLPFILALAGLLVLVWIVWGSEAERHLLPFGLGLGFGLPAIFVATVGPARWLDTSCDAFSSAYLWPGLAGAIVIIGLGLLSKRFARLRSFRAAFAVLGALIVAGAFVATNRVCLVNPFAGIDPLLREIWLDNVSEAMPLRRLFETKPYTAMIFALPILFGFAAILAAARRETGLMRRRWIFLAAMSFVGAALSFWMIRVVGFAAPLALLGGAWSINEFAIFLRRKWTKGAALALGLALPFSSIGWALPFSQQDEKMVVGSTGACLAPQALAPLAALEPGLFAAPIDAGSYILAFTGHAVVAGPYHRDNHGNRIMIDAFLAEPAAAEKILREDHVDYVALCSDLKETERLAERAPNGLAATLLGGQIADFLAPVLPSDARPNSKYHVFKLRPSQMR